MYGFSYEISLPSMQGKETWLFILRLIQTKYDMFFKSAKTITKIVF